MDIQQSPIILLTFPPNHSLYTLTTILYLPSRFGLRECDQRCENSHGTLWYFIHGDEGGKGGSWGAHADYDDCRSLLFAAMAMLFTQCVASPDGSS